MLFRSVVVGTVGTRIAGRDVRTSLTTPEAPDLHGLFAVMRERGVEACAMEVSSHALVMGRVAKPGVVLAPAWPLAVASAFLGGFGLGGVSACLNAAYASVGARAVNLVNAVFGVGSMIAPLLVVSLYGEATFDQFAAHPVRSIAITLGLFSAGWGLYAWRERRQRG